MAQVLEITNPTLDIKERHDMKGQNFVLCNKNKDVYKHIKTGTKYVIELPATNTVLNVTCSFAAIRAADMHIDSCTVNGVPDNDAVDCKISYQYDNFGSIHYSSFSYREICNVYISVNDII